MKIITDKKEQRQMTNDEAIKVIQEKIDEMLDDKKVQEIIIALKREGKTNKEIRNIIIVMATVLAMAKDVGKISAEYREPLEKKARKHWEKVWEPLEKRLEKFERGLGENWERVGKG